MWMRGVFVAIALSAAACSSVTTGYPIGEKALEVEPEEWAGTWLASDGEVLVLSVSDGANGVLVGAWFEENEEGPVLQQSKIYIRELAGWVFASMAAIAADPSDPVEYDWVRIENNGKVILFWLPDVEKFRSLVERGVLPGQTNGASVTLGLLNSNHYGLIASEKEGVLFEWENPHFYRRVKQ